MIGATILFGDLWILNMNGKGWMWLRDETFKNVTPNYMPGLIMCLCLIGCVLMMIAYWNVKQKTREVRNMTRRVGQKDEPKKAAPKPDARALLPEPPVPTLPETKEHQVTIGIEFAIANQEVSIKAIAEDGPAFESIPKILVGDVVHRVWDDKDPEPVAGAALTCLSRYAIRSPTRASPRHPCCARGEDTADARGCDCGGLGRQTTTGRRRLSRGRRSCASRLRGPSAGSSSTASRTTRRT